jgi:hypothetical protein
MKFICLFLLALGSVLSAGERFSLQLPSGWKNVTSQVKEDGKIFEVWFQGGEQHRVINVTSPYGQGKRATIEEAVEGLLQPMNAYGVNCKVFGSSQDEALVGWTIPGDNVTLVRMVSTPFGLHSVMYSYQGPETASIDSDKWLQFLHGVPLVQMSGAR